MNKMTKFAETFDELIFESGMDNKSIAKEIDISASCITDYLRNGSLPTVTNLIKIANYFNCSTDFLLGLENENKNLIFKVCPPFNEQIEILKKYFNCDNSYFYTETGISKSRFFDWKSGKRMPTLDNIIRLSELFERRIDFILGREI